MLARKVAAEILAIDFDRAHAAAKTEPEKLRNRGPDSHEYNLTLFYRILCRLDSRNGAGVALGRPAIRGGTRGAQALQGKQKCLALPDVAWNAASSVQYYLTRK